jgi:hypothetical protein
LRSLVTTSAAAREQQESEQQRDGAPTHPADAARARVNTALTPASLLEG